MIAVLDPSDTGHAEADRVIGRLASSDPDFDDCTDAVVLIRRLVADLKGPDGYATWNDAAVAERLKRQQAEHERDAAIETVADLSNLLGAWLQWFGSTNDISERTRAALDVPAAPKQCACDQPYADTCMAAYWRAGICCRLTGETTQGTRTTSRE